MQYIGDNEIVGKYLGDTEVQKQYLGDTLVWENTPTPVGPADNEIWYTTTDGNPISISGFNITGNTYNNGQGILSFSTTVTEIGREMFLEKSTLRTMILPSTVTSVNYRPWRKTPNLTAITGTENITNSIAYGFYYANGVKELNLPSLRELNKGNLGFCDNLESIVLTSVTGITYTDNFYYCAKLKSITFGETVPVNNGGTTNYYYFPGNGTLHVPAAKVSDYEEWISNGGFKSGWSVVGY